MALDVVPFSLLPACAKHAPFLKYSYYCGHVGTTITFCTPHAGRTQRRYHDNGSSLLFLITIIFPLERHRLQLVCCLYSTNIDIGSKDPRDLHSHPRRKPHSGHLSSMDTPLRHRRRLAHPRRSPQFSRRRSRPASVRRLRNRQP